MGKVRRFFLGVSGANKTNKANKTDKANKGNKTNKTNKVNKTNSPNRTYGVIFIPSLREGYGGCQLFVLLYISAKSLHPSGS